MGLGARGELAVPQPDGHAGADALAGGVMEQDRVAHVGQNPHAAARAVLLNVDFVEGPEVGVRVAP